MATGRATLTILVHTFITSFENGTTALKVENCRAFDNPLVFKKHEPGAFENWYTRAALAEETPDHLARARKRVVEAGVDPAFLDAVTSLAHTQVLIEAWRREYNEERPKKGLGGLTPAQYAKRLVAERSTVTIGL